jgi:hypothetical protein
MTLALGDGVVSWTGDIELDLNWLRAADGGERDLIASLSGAASGQDRFTMLTGGVDSSETYRKWEHATDPSGYTAPTPYQFKVGYGAYMWFYQDWPMEGDYKDWPHHWLWHWYNGSDILGKINAILSTAIAEIATSTYTTESIVEGTTGIYCSWRNEGYPYGQSVLLPTIEVWRRSPGIKEIECRWSTSLPDGFDFQYRYRVEVSGDIIERTEWADVAGAASPTILTHEPPFLTWTWEQYTYTKYEVIRTPNLNGYPIYTYDTDGTGGGYTVSGAGGSFINVFIELRLKDPYV